MKVFLFSFKVEIQQIQEMEENPFGENLLKMNLNRILSTREEEFFQWRIPEHQEQMDRNCNSFFLRIFVQFREFSIQFLVFHSIL